MVGETEQFKLQWKVLGMFEDGIFVLGTTFKVSGELSFAIWDHLKTQRCKALQKDV